MGREEVMESDQKMFGGRAVHLRQNWATGTPTKFCNTDTIETI
jgi:hypothetical protein